METSDVARERMQRFRTLYDAAYLDLLRFAQRRVHATHAEDVISDVMLVAWRRLEDVPADLSDARAWLFGVARHTIQNTRRREGKQEALAVHLSQSAPVLRAACAPTDALIDRADIADAWSRLSAVYQEALALAVLEGLSAPEAAAVLGISPTAFRLRLSRARKSLRSAIDAPQTDRRRPRDLDTQRSHP